ncbi:hypothetical protein, partial [Undibacterium sp. RuTC16W]|uniref:hypothetical protein n=1 Tax=Undibacterium sp. RuTC16W TaxID=3413048 RepID=UPI003BF27EDB
IEAPADESKETKLEKRMKQSERVAEILRELSGHVAELPGSEVDLRALRGENLRWEKTHFTQSSVVDSTLEGTFTVIVRIRKTYRDKTA